MSGKQRLPGRLRAALGCGLDAVVLEDRLIVLRATSQLRLFSAPRIRV
jgi:hypothetical protein